MSDSLYRMLEQIGTGMHKCKSGHWWLDWWPWLGWIEVTGKDGTFDAMWCNSKHSHDYILSTSPAFSVEVDRQDETKWVFKSALSMWPVNNKEHQRYYYNQMFKKVRLIIQDQKSV